MRPNITELLRRRRPLRAVADVEISASGRPVWERELTQVPLPQRTEKLSVTVLAENCPKSKSKK